MPIGRSPRTDVLLKAEKAVLEFGGSVVRLAGLYISLIVDSQCLDIFTQLTCFSKDFAYLHLP